jgi:hypothetical protein
LGYKQSEKLFKQLREEILPKIEKENSSSSTLSTALLQWLFNERLYLPENCSNPQVDGLFQNHLLDFIFQSEELSVCYLYYIHQILA